ncbi:hypothetical protein pipiens_020238, partial [Culex pipiens pipiens]
RTTHGIPTGGARRWWRLQIPGRPGPQHGPVHGRIPAKRRRRVLLVRAGLRAARTGPPGLRQRPVDPRGDSLLRAERGRREGPDADLDRRGRHPPEGHRRVDVGLLFARDVLPHEAGTGSVVVREPARAVHGAAGAAGLWQVVLR